MSTFNSVDSLQSQFQIGKLLGTTGSLGALVHLAKYKKNGKWVAIKKYNEGGLEGTIETRAEEDAAHYIQHEVTMMKLLCHENILKCVSSIVVDSQIWIVTPLMVYGSVSNLLKEHFQEGLSELACCFIIKDLLHALQYIHDQGVVHRSVRCSHLLINESGRCVLTGFRYSTPLNAIGDQSSTLYDYPLHCITSNLEWLAPEILKQNLLGYSETSDIYSLGVVACEMANGIVPFSDFPSTLMFIEKLNGSSPRLMDFNTINAAKQEDADAGREEFGSSSNMMSKTSSFYTREFNSCFHDFVNECTICDGDERPTASQLLGHPFLKQIKKTTSSLLPLLQPAQPLYHNINMDEFDDGLTTGERNNINDVAELGDWDFD